MKKAILIVAAVVSGCLFADISRDDLFQRVELNAQRDGKRAYLIATVYRGRDATFDVCAKGLANRSLKSVTVVDGRSDGTRADPASVVTRTGDILTFRKSAPERASAYLLEFE